MRVLTVKNYDITEYVTHIVRKMEADGYHPDAVIGILSGGVPIADIFAQQLGLNGGVALRISVFRQTSKNKKRFLSRIVKLLPTKILDYLRILEAKMTFRGHTRRRVFDVVLPVELEDTRYSKILIVDDAIDSGATMSEVLKQVSKEYPNIEIKTAVMTVTTDNPIVCPDYCMYKNSILMRFPWSLDSK